VLRPIDTMLLALARYGAWARGRMVYRALFMLATPPRVRR